MRYNVVTSFRYSLSIALLALSAVIAGCGGGGGDAPAAVQPGVIRSRADINGPGTWTVLVYLDADNDLETAGIRNFNQMEMVGSTQNVHVIVQMDRMSGDDPHNERWTDTRRYLITNDSDTMTMHSVRLDYPSLGEQDMGSANTLHDFVQWGMQSFPADHYMVVIWDHGTGWMIRPSSAMIQYKYVSVDSTSGTFINVTLLPTALAALHPDVIAFDACYMQEIEVAYQLSGSADYMVGSSAAVPSAGYN
jgi:hypothetical protein